MTELFSDLEDDLDMEDDIPPPAPSSFSPPNRQGSLLVTLLDQNPYSLWGLPKLATRPPDFCPGTRDRQPRYKLTRSFEFKPEVYEGYGHRRTLGFKKGVSKDGNQEIIGRKGGARTWEFVRREQDEE